MKKGIIVLLLLLLAGGLFFFFGPAGKDKADAVDQGPAKAKPNNVARVEVEAVSRVPLLQKGYRESSTLEALEEVVLYPRVTGRLEKYLVEEGQILKKGQVIAELDHRDVDAQINSIEAQIAVSQAQLASARATHTNAASERDRYRKLVEEGYATTQQLDDKETAYLQSEANVKLYNATIQQYRSSLEKEKVNLSEYVIKSPIEGRVLDDYSLTPGEMITPSTAIAQVGKTGSLKAVIKAPESRAVNFTEGMKAVLTVDSLGDKKFEGKITLVSPSVDTSTRTTKVEVIVDNSEGMLKPGMFAEVFIVEKEKENALAIPAEAIIGTGGTFHLLVVQDDQVKQVDFNAGIVTDDLVEVLDGLEEGQKVVVSGGNLLKDNDKVAVINRK
jgi:RND family efflux transporter MFP subunit